MVNEISNSLNKMVEIRKGIRFVKYWQVVCGMLLLTLLTNLELHWKFAARCSSQLVEAGCSNLSGPPEWEIWERALERVSGLCQNSNPWLDWGTYL